MRITRGALARATINAYPDTALRTMFAATAMPRQLMETESVACIAHMAMGPAPVAVHHVHPANASTTSSETPQSQAANHPPSTTAPPPVTTPATRAGVRPPSFWPPAATSRTTATTPSTCSPQAPRSGSRTRTWSPWMCWSLEAAEVVLRSGVVAVAGQCRNSTAEL